MLGWTDIIPMAGSKGSDTESLVDSWLSIILSGKARTGQEYVCQVHKGGQYILDAHPCRPLFKLFFFVCQFL